MNAAVQLGYEPLANSIICGDALKVLPDVSSGTVDAVVTSPPYFGQRDYSHPDQIGNEATPNLYEGHRWSLTGRLLGPRFDSHRGTGGAAGFQSGLTRTLAGLESALSYSRSAGKGKHGRTPDLLRPVRKGGAGPDTFIPWRALLSLAGEPVPADAKSESVWGRRYRRRVDALIAAGYLIPAPGGVAPAGDTVEIVRVVDGRGHGHVAGVRIRASARFCAAYQDQVKTRLPAARVFTP